MQSTLIIQLGGHLRLKVLATFILITPSAFAEVLQPGKFQARSAVAFSSGSNVWMGSTKKGIGAAPPGSAAGSQGPTLTAARTTTATTQSPQGSLTSFYFDNSVSAGIIYGFQLDANLLYQYTKLSGADEGGSSAGDFLAGFAEIGFRVTKAALEAEPLGDEGTFGLNAYVGVRAPGNSPQNPDDFLAINDGAVKFDFGVHPGFRFEYFAIETDLAFIARPHPELANQINLSLAVPFFVGDISVGPYLAYFATLSGADIGDSEFTAIRDAEGRPPFSIRAERFLTLGGFVAIPLSDEFSLDISLEGKAAGQNTLSGGGAGAGVTYSF